MALKPDTTYAEADIAASAVIPALAVLTGATLTTQRIVYKSILNDGVPATSGSLNRNAGVFIFNVPVDVPGCLIEIPAIVGSIFLTTGPFAGYVIDPTNTDVIAFVNAILDNGVVNPFNEELTGLSIAYLQSRV